MLFENWFRKKISNTWLKYNFQYFIIGIIIGTLLNVLFEALSYNDNRGWRNFLMTYVVSILITLSITNISILSSCIIRLKFSTPFINILLNFLLIAVGTIIGTEISFLFVMTIYEVPFSEISQAANLKFNLTIGLVVGTIIYLYQLQRDNYNLKIHDKEVQLLKLKELKTVADLKTLQARINPHFLYNALNSITSLIHESPDKAETMTIKLSQLFRYSINTQESNWATVKEELEMVNTYLDIERERFGNRISFSTEANESVLNNLIPRFLLQPLVENALKHGLKNTAKDGELSLQIKNNGPSLEISVHDNGAPFPSEMMVGYGIQSTIDKLNLLYGDAWKLEYVNSPQKRICIEIPNKTKS